MDLFYHLLHVVSDFHYTYYVLFVLCPTVSDPKKIRFLLLTLESCWEFGCCDHQHSLLLIHYMSVKIM